MTRIIHPKPVAQKSTTFTSRQWRESARGKPCMLALPGICNRDRETTVLAHLRMFGWAGAAQKPPDFLAIYTCSACHDALDRRGATAGVDPWDILRGLGETLKIHHEEGRIG